MRYSLAIGLLVVCGAAAGGRGMVADYSAYIPEAAPRADGRRHIDTRATIARLRNLHANTYFYLVHSQTDWDDLVADFLPAADKAALDVWLYFVPPSECPATCTLPFEKDYMRIAAGTARLSLEHPNLKGLAIDDFADNLKLYTPEYVGRMRAAGTAVNPKFKFYPLLYWRSMQPEFLDQYAAVIDGVIFAYRDEPTINTTRNGSLREQLSAAERLTSDRGKSLVLMIYCTPLGRIPIPPGVEYVRDSVRMGLDDVRAGRLAGVVTYVLRKNGEPAPAAENYAHSGNGRGTILASGRGIPAGSYAELSCPVSFGPAPARLTLWRTALFTKLPPGYFALQILLDDRVVWEQDAAAFENKTWGEEHVDLGSARGSTLRVRLALKRNTGSIAVIVGLDDLKPEGFTLEDAGFEDPARWKPAATSPALVPMIQMFDAQRPIRMFEAVRELYSLN